MNNIWVICFIIFLTLMGVGQGISQYYKSQERIAFANVGLEECVVEWRTVWKKECD